MVHFCLFAIISIYLCPNQHLIPDQMGKLKATLLDRGTVWLDTGTHESLYSASSYVRVIEQRQGMKIGCLEEIAWKEGLISESQLISRVTEFGGSDYGRYLNSLIEKKYN
jgi:glucose-1-phosphate thymidylyltransferase